MRCQDDFQRIRHGNRQKRIVGTEPALRAITLILIIGAGVVISRWTPLGEQLTEERIVGALLEIRSIAWAPAVLLFLYTVLAPFGVPMVPLLVTGAIFGAVPGAMYNTLGLILGAFSSYWLARSLGRDFVLQRTGDRVRRVERLVHRHGFWPLVQTRFLPLPFLAVNVSAALAGIGARRFISASIVGLIPSTIIHSFFISQLIFASGSARIHYGIAYGLIFLACNLGIAIPWMRAQLKRRSRYRALMEMRAGRVSKTPS